MAGRGQISLQQWDLLWSPSKGPVSGGGGGGVHNMLITEGQVLNQGFKDGSYRSTVGGLLISHLQSRGLTARSWEIQNLYVTAAVRGSRLLMMAPGRVNRGTGRHQMSHKLIFSPPSPPTADSRNVSACQFSRGAFWGSRGRLARQMKCLDWAALRYLWPLAETPPQSHWDLSVA